MTVIVHTANASDALFSMKFEGYRVDHFQFDPYLQRLIINLEPTGDPICPRCGKPSRKVHDRTLRDIRDTPIVNCEEVILRFRIRRVRCSCGCHQCEKLSWLEPKARLTNAFVGWVQALLRLQVSISDIVRFTGLSWDTVKQYDKLQLEHLFGQMDLSRVRHLAIDEFSLHKGHRYATVVMDIEERRVIWVGVGKTVNSVKPFFDLLRQKGLCERIRSVSCDMNAAYPKMVRDNLPNAVILYDLFHVMKHFTEEVLIEAKKRLWAEHNPNLSLDKSSLRGVEWLLVRHSEGIKPKKQELLNTLLQDNQLLAALYPIAQMIREIWSTKSQHLAHRLIENLRHLLHDIYHRFEFKPAKSFAMMLHRREEGIVWNGQFGFGTNRLEGANNKIKVAKRIAYGFRDFDYFALKIKAMLPGIHYSPWTDFHPGQAILKSGTWKCCFPAIS